MTLKNNRFWSKVNKTNSCWNWKGSQNGTGYGKVFLNKKYWYVHRFSYELHIGKIPEGLVIDHLCRNRACANPEHLEAVTQKINIQKGLSGKHTNHFNNFKTHCPQGHEYTKENTYFRKIKKNRRCKICTRLSNTKSKLKKELILL